MKQIQDVKAQREFIINDQIKCLRERRKACARVWDQTEWDHWTAEYMHLEGELKKLDSPTSVSAIDGPPPVVMGELARPEND